MNLTSVRSGFVAIAFSLAATGMFATGASAEEYSFTAINTTNSLITEIWVSEDKNDWGYFDIGSGIPAGRTANLVWSQSTNSDNCSQWVTATWEDGSESEPAMIDFCEAGLQIEF